MNLAKYDRDTFDLEELFAELEDYEEKPVIKKMRKEDKYTKHYKQDKGKLREIKRNQENEE